MSVKRLQLHVLVLSITVRLYMLSSSEGSLSTSSAYSAKHFTLVGLTSLIVKMLKIGFHVIQSLKNVRVEFQSVQQR